MGRARHRRSIPVNHHGSHERPSNPPSGVESGTGLLSSAAAVGVFLILLLFAIQLTLSLAATSAVSAAGYDAARVVAARRVNHRDPAAVASAEREATGRFHTLLGRTAEGAALTWVVDTTSVRLRARVPLPRVLPPALGGAIGPDHVDRTFVVRIEQAP